MKYALIGCGRIATNHIKAVLNNSLELVAVCDICLLYTSCHTARAAAGSVRFARDV